MSAGQFIILEPQKGALPITVASVDQEGISQHHLREVGKSSIQLGKLGEGMG
jgi:hypothetical protein